MLHAQILDKILASSSSSFRIFLSRSRLRPLSQRENGATKKKKKKKGQCFDWSKNERQKHKSKCFDIISKDLPTDDSAIFFIGIEN